MRTRVLTALLTGLAVWAVPGIAAAALDNGMELTWVFWMSVLILVGFLAFVGFFVVYYLIAVAARNRRFAVQTVVAPAPAAPAPAPAAVGAPAAPPAAASAAPAAAAASAAPAAAAAPAPSAAPAPAQAAPAVPGALPPIDPMNLPAGIDAVARGRLKKLAVFQERGQAPPRELIENLKPMLEQIAGKEIDVDAAASAAPAAAAPAAPPATPAPAEPAAPAEPPAPAEQPPPAQPAPAAAAPAPAEPAAAPAEPAAAPAADTGGLPRIDINKLPPGIDAVARGRLKKLAILQERGQQPPDDLVDSLRPILDQLQGS